MKKVNDENVVKFVKENTNYEIKTTSQSILNQYNFEKSLESQKPVKKHKFAIAFSSILGTLALVGAAASAIFFFNPTTDQPHDNNIVFPDTNPNSNNVLKKQLITFSAFSAQGNENSGLKKRILRQQENLVDDDNEQNPSIQSELIKKSVDVYEEIETSVNYLYHESNVRTETSPVKATFDKINYTLVTKFYYLDDENPFALYYFNEPSEEKDDDEVVRKSKAYYSSGNVGFNVDVVEEAETDGEENEVETKLTLRDVHKVSKEVFVIEKENETETEEDKLSIENTLSFKTYADETSYLEDEYSRKVSAETEAEGKETEIKVKVKTNEYKAEYIIEKVSETNLNLLTTYEDKVVDEDAFEEELINLEYKETERTYTWKEFNWSFKK